MGFYWKIVIVTLTSLVFFLLAGIFTPAKALENNGLFLLEENKVFKQLNHFYSEKLPIKNSSLTQGTECGGGTQRTIGECPLIFLSSNFLKNISSSKIVRGPVGHTALATTLATNTCLDCDLDLTDTTQEPSVAALNNRCVSCIALYGVVACTNMCNVNRWDEAIIEAKAAGLNPTFVVALGIEETYFGAANPLYPFGCMNPNQQGFSLNLECAVNTLKNCLGDCAACAQCSDLMGVLACYASSDATCTLDNNPNFNESLTSIFAEIGGTLTGDCADTGVKPDTCMDGLPPPPGTGCGGGTQGTIGEGPLIPNINYCTDADGTPSCKGIAECAGNKIGVPNIGYLWDSVSKICGLGVPIDQAIIDECKTGGPPPPSGTCSTLPPGGFYGMLSNDRFNELIPYVEEMTEKVFTEFGYSVRKEFLLAVMHTESGWTLNPGVPAAAGEFCIFPGWNDWATFNGPNICGHPNVAAEVMADFGQACNMMNVSADPDDPNIDPPCGGAMGMAQFIPGTWVGKLPDILQLTGRAFANPYNERDAIAAATLYLGQLLDWCGGSEELASGAYYTGACVPGTLHWIVVSLRLPFAEDMVADACTISAIGDACPILMEDPSIVQPSAYFCVRLESDFCPIIPDCSCYLEGFIHHGVDLNITAGQFLYAPEDGNIVDWEESCAEGVFGCGGGYGNRIVLQGNSGRWYLYAHIEQSGVLKTGAVTKGDRIGRGDNTGFSFGDHLHFEVSLIGNPWLGNPRVDPRTQFTCIPAVCGGVNDIWGLGC